MIRAILDGRKTQTRRTVAHEHIAEADIFSRAPDEQGRWEFGIAGEGGVFAHGDFIRCPYGTSGDRLWVRETFTHITGNGIRVHYKADGEPTDLDGNLLTTEAGLPRWRPSIFMRRSESRITLEITEVRVQRLQEISDDDARAEGVEPYTPPHGHISPDQRVPGPGFERCRLGDQPYRLPFADLWDLINRKRAPWVGNPWVWAISFRRLP